MITSHRPGQVCRHGNCTKLEVFRSKATANISQTDEMQADAIATGTLRIPRLRSMGELKELTMAQLARDAMNQYTIEKVRHPPRFSLVPLIY
jgi:hypothetical protein